MNLSIFVACSFGSYKTRDTTETELVVDGGMSARPASNINSEI